MTKTDTLDTTSYSSSTLTDISKRYKTLKNAEQKAARFILANPQRVAVSPLRSLAKECEVSEPTILRFCRSLGFGGYQDFKISLIPQILRENLKNTERAGSSPIPFWLGSLAQRASSSAGDSISGLDGKVLAATVDRVLSARRVVVTGLGGAAGVGYILADSLAGLGVPCICTHDPSYLQVLPESLSSEDIVIGISHSGETEEIVHTLVRAREKSAKTVAITNYQGAPLDKAADLTLFTACVEDIFGSYSPVPRIGELAVVVALVEEVGARRTEPADG